MFCEYFSLCYLFAVQHKRQCYDGASQFDNLTCKDEYLSSGTSENNPYDMAHVPDDQDDVAHQTNCPYEVVHPSTGRYDMVQPTNGAYDVAHTPNSTYTTDGPYDLTHKTDDPYDVAYSPNGPYDVAHPQPSVSNFSPSKSETSQPLYSVVHKL